MNTFFCKFLWGLASKHCLILSLTSKWSCRRDHSMFCIIMDLRELFCTDWQACIAFLRSQVSILIGIASDVHQNKYDGTLCFKSNL
jgi:hypothetical protein